MSTSKTSSSSIQNAKAAVASATRKVSNVQGMVNDAKTDASRERAEKQLTMANDALFQAQAELKALQEQHYSADVINAITGEDDEPQAPVAEIETPVNDVVEAVEQGTEEPVEELTDDGTPPSFQYDLGGTLPAFSSFFKDTNIKVDSQGVYRVALPRGATFQDGLINAGEILADELMAIELAQADAVRERLESTVEQARADAEVQAVALNEADDSDEAFEGLTASYTESVFALSAAQNELERHNRRVLKLSIRKAQRDQIKEAEADVPVDIHDLTREQIDQSFFHWSESMGVEPKFRQIRGIKAVHGQFFTELRLKARQSFLDLVDVYQPGDAWAKFQAITGWSDLEIAVFQTSMWQVMQTARGLDLNQRNPMVVLCGKQDCGKSLIIEEIFGGPLTSLYYVGDMSVSKLANSFNRAMFVDNYVLRWDELDKLEGVNLNNFKAISTAVNIEFARKGGRSERGRKAAVSIGTSNKPLQDVYLDTTGSTRMFQINCPDSPVEADATQAPLTRIALAESRGDDIGFTITDLWLGIDADQPAPIDIAGLRGELKLEQKKVAVLDNVEMFYVAEGAMWISEGRVTINDMYQGYNRFCKGQKFRLKTPVSRAEFVERVIELTEWKVGKQRCVARDKNGEVVYKKATIAERKKACKADQITAGKMRASDKLPAAVFEEWDMSFDGELPKYHGATPCFIAE